MEDLFEPVLRKTSILVKRQVAGVKGAKGMPPIKVCRLAATLKEADISDDLAMRRHVSEPLFPRQVP